jgi:hypothetical protein
MQEIRLSTLIYAPRERVFDLARSIDAHHSGLFQPFSTFSRSSLGNGRDADEGDVGIMAA